MRDENKSKEQLLEEVKALRERVTALEMSEKGLKQHALLEKVEKRNKALLDFSPVCHKIIDLDSNLQFMNVMGFRMLKLEVTDEVFGKPYPFDFFPEAHRQNLIDCLRQVKETGERVVLEGKACDSEGNAVWLYHNFIPVAGEDGELDFITVVSSDITDQKKSEEALRISEEKYRRLAENSPAVVYQFKLSHDGVFSFPYVSNMILEVTGIRSQDLMKDAWLLLNKIHPDDEASFQKSILSSAEFLAPWCEKARFKVNEDYVWMEGFSTPERLENGDVIWDGLFFNITERIEVDQQIKASLEEKETLLHEIHHRVKNNMQVIASLLKLQLNRKKKQDVDGILKENIGRVYAMAEIHENLHRSDKLTEINFRPYVQKLTQMLSQTYSVDSKKVAFQVDTPELKLSIDKANPVGLVLNEMISNSLKYAFSDGQKGTISIKSRMLDGDIIELVVADDGVGIAEGIDWEKLDTLGLNLIQNLVRNQLNGSIDLDTTNGTKFTIKFNIKSNYKS